MISKRSQIALNFRYVLFTELTFRLWAIHLGPKNQDDAANQHAAGQRHCDTRQSAHEEVFREVSIFKFLRADESLGCDEECDRRVASLGNDRK